MWEAEMNKVVPQDLWKGGVYGGIASYKFKYCTWTEFKRKVFTSFFRTPEITTKTGLTQPSSCWWNCETHTHTHIFWLCPKLRSFCRMAFDALRRFSNRTFHMTPECHYLELNLKAWMGKPRNTFSIYYLQQPRSV